MNSRKVCIKNYLRYDETTVICRKKQNEQKNKQKWKSFENNRLKTRPMPLNWVKKSEERERATKQIIRPCSRVLPRGKNNMHNSA